MAKIPCSLIVTTPVRRSAREVRYQCGLLFLLERLLPYSSYDLNKIVFLGGAGLISAKSHTAYATSAPLQRAYQCLAEHTGSELLLCGQSAAHYGLREADARAEPWHLTGYMEMLAQLGASVHGDNAKVMCLNSTTSSAALSVALKPPSIIGSTAPMTTVAEKGTLHVCFTFPAVLPLAVLAMAQTLSSFPNEVKTDVSLARQYEWAWHWEQGLNLLLNAAELELPVAAYFVDLRLFTDVTARLAAYAQPRYRHLQPATLLPQLKSVTLVKQLRQLELYDIRSYFCGTSAARYELSTALAPLKLQTVDIATITALLAHADWPLIVV